MYDATIKADLEDLCQRCHMLNAEGKRWLAANTVLRELMIEPTMDTILKQLSGTLSQEQLDAAVHLAWNLMPEAEVNNFIDVLCGHMVEGTDRTPNSDAVGGFCQNELNALTELVKLAEHSFGHS